MPRERHYALVNVRMTCESCGHEYEDEDVITGSDDYMDDGFSTQNLFAVQSGQARLQQKMARLERGDFRDLNTHKCPNCGYIQSWNVERAKRRRTLLPMLLAALVSLGLLPLFGRLLEAIAPTANFLVLRCALWLVAVIVIDTIVYQVLTRTYNPNRKLPPAERPIPPQVTRAERTRYR